jgi:hypothetical protein
MKRVLFIGLCLMACSTPEGSVPPDVLPRDRFRTVLREAHMIEARMNHEVVVAHARSVPAEKYYTEMFEAEGTTKEEFQRSFAYYSGRPTEMKALYEEILNELSLRKDEVPH